ncbi:PREDICTED: OX-2 membrane glycoprotein [Chrysochloris asiatica]|uniref:OX-2 membrane glycoprotein n=1 Tax=Chrysochloris asiatica TaxID=185453 RepID=A0A9B0WPL0_CHRAS|nr:PREDICTED: OX-2 membrane glycoprotein [Chrysochloris asiatica]
MVKEVPGDPKKAQGSLFHHLSTYSLVYSMAAIMLCEAQVVTTNERELLHTSASLSCSLKTHQEVLIVTWQKMKATSPENMVTFSKNHGVEVQPVFKGRVNITHLGLSDSTITFWNTTLEDEGCYMCLFNTFGSGKISGKTCLTLYVQPIVSLNYTFFEDHLNITCSATARPAPIINWKVDGSGIENSTESLSHPNGTTSVTSILHIRDPESQVGKEVICKVLHLGTVKDFKQTVTKGFWFSIPLLLSIVSLVILLVLISILLYWKRHRNQDRVLNLAVDTSSEITTKDLKEKKKEEEEGGEKEEEEVEGNGEEEDGDEDEEAEAATGKQAAEDDENDDVDTKKQKTNEDD